MRDGGQPRRHTVTRMGWWDRRRRRAPQTGAVDGPDMAIDLKAVRAHLEQFVATRRGVEAYVEPATSVTATTMILIATDGEWTRRAVGSPKTAGEIARDLMIPVYDVHQTGYPARMREWNSRQRRR